jgi:hypothetical protein
MNTTIATETINNNSVNELQMKKFNDIIISFKEKSNLTGLTSDEHILYNLVRGLPKDKGFTVITNKKELANGVRPDYGFYLADYIIRSKLRNKKDILIEMFKIPLDHLNDLLTLLNK